MEGLALTVMADAAVPDHRTVAALALAEANVHAVVHPQTLLPNVDFLRVIFRTSRAETLTRYVAVTESERVVLTSHPERFFELFGSSISTAKTRDWALLYLEVCRSTTYHSGFYYPDGKMADDAPMFALLFAPDLPMSGLGRARVMRWASQIDGDESVAIRHIFRTYAQAKDHDMLLRQLPAAMLSLPERRHVQALFERRTAGKNDWLIQWWPDISPVDSVRRRRGIIGRCERPRRDVVYDQETGLPKHVPSPQGRYAILTPFRPQHLQPDIGYDRLWSRVTEGFMPRGEGLPYRGRQYVLSNVVPPCKDTYVLQLDGAGAVLDMQRWDVYREVFVDPKASAKLAADVDWDGPEDLEPFALFLPWLDQSTDFENPMVDGPIFRAVLFEGNALVAVKLNFTSVGIIDRRVRFGLP